MYILLWSIIFSPTIEEIKDPLLLERLRFFHEKPLKMNFDGIRIWEIFSIKRILKRAEKMIIQWNKLRTRSGECGKHSRKTRVVFQGCAKMCVAGHDGRSRPSFWPILDVSAERSPSNDQIAWSIRRHRWFGSLGAALNKLLSW